MKIRKTLGSRGTDKTGGLKGRIKDAIATQDKSRASGAERTEQTGHMPDATRDVFGGVVERLGVAHRLRNPDDAKELDAALAKLARDAVVLADHVEESGGIAGRGLVRGVGAGQLARNVDEARRCFSRGQPFVLVVREVTAAVAELAAHAEALVVIGRKGGAQELARAVGKPAVRVAATDLATLSGPVSVDGTSGRVVSGRARVVKGERSSAVDAQVASLREKFGLVVTAQASTPENIAVAKLHGADRIRVDSLALVAGKRTLAHLRRYLLETEAAPRRSALEHIVALARTDARGLLDAAGELPTTFVLGDQAPHALFPAADAELDALATEMGLPKQLVRDRVSELGGGNSKLGLRGARWAAKDPELFASWARAIFEAAADKLEAGEPAGPLRLHIPNVALGSELALVKEKIESERRRVEDEYGLSLDVSFSAGIDTARGALSTDEIAAHAGALEYSAADMTETLYAISRDDAEQYLPHMLAQGLLAADPFSQLDVDAVGKMIRVGQFLAGESPNTFPAALVGPQALTANGMFVAAQSGIHEVVVPAHSALTARALHARVHTVLRGTVGLTTGKTELRDTSARLFDHLLERDGKVQKQKSAVVPAELTALEHVERLEKLVDAGALSTAEALLQVPANIVDQLSKPVIDPKANVQALAKGIAASPGCGQGRVALSKEAAAELEKAGEPYVLIVNEVHADEVEATRKAAGLVSVRGGKTSHAAMIASNSDVPCVMQDKVQINLDNNTALIGKTKVQQGDWVTIDGTKGQIFPGKVPLLNPTKSTAFSSLMKWADEHRTMQVLANADTPAEATAAFQRGAEGVGLVRSEHMFYQADRLRAFRAVILSDVGQRPADLAALEQAQVDDYVALFRAAGEKKVAVRLLDPPLYEFVPQKPDEIRELAALLGLSDDKLLERINSKQEIDSLLGMRGVRLALTRPDIESMQVRALARAWVAAAKDGPVAPLHVIVPQVSEAKEMEAARTRILAVLDAVAKESGVAQIPIKLGSMIETPRAALEAHHIAAHVDFFSYGTNDLTQGTLGYGRNVAAKFIPELIKAKALDADPTESLDEKGVVKLIKVAEALGQDENPKLYGGVCGGQAGDPRSIDALQRARVKYISVSPGQVAKARLAAGQAAVKPKDDAAKTVASSEHGALARDLERAMRAIRTLPTTAADAATLEHLELLVRRGSVTIRVAQGGGVSVVELAPLMARVTAARELLDTNKLAQALVAEAGSLAQDARKLPKGPAAERVRKLLAEAHTAAEAFGALATASLSKPRSTSTERNIASQAWTALRAFEGAREAMREIGVLPAQHEHTARLWHHNDGWDNPHYTKGGPHRGESMIAFMKRAANDFLADNDLSVSLAGYDLAKLRKDRPIVLAVTHRSGAIDRFVTMSSLPFDDDELMYVVRKGSPYDVIAKESFSAQQNPVLAPESAADLLDAAKRGFANGKRVLLTYPQGTGPIVGEPRYPATSTARLALEAGALLVPVSIDDTFAVRPFSGGSVTLKVHAPIDALKVEQEAKAAGVDAADLLHTQLHYELSKSFRAEI